MTLTTVITSFTLALINDFIVMVGVTSFFYWVNSSTAPAFVRQHRLPFTLVSGYGFVAYLCAQMAVHADSGNHWPFLNMLIVTLYMLNMQLGLRWQALVDAGAIVACYLVLSRPLTLLGVVAVIIAAGTLYWTQARSEQIAQRRVLKYGGLFLFAAAMLTLAVQMTGVTIDLWFWLRQVGSLIVLSVLCLEFDQIMRLTQKRTDQMHALTTIDELTGVRNFGTFSQELKTLFAQFQKDGVQYSVFEGDLDHFKHINDTYGHLSGNAVLKQLALELDEFADTLPFPATAYRLGGEEFAIIAHTALNHEQAMQIGERFLELLTLVRFPEADPNLTITCSIGQARVESGDYSANDVYKKADRNLYATKQNGRNCVRAQDDGATA